MSAVSKLRLVLAAIAVIAAVLVLRSSMSLMTASPRPTRPASVLIITLDATRADRLEPYGAAAGSTPVLARLATEGAVFADVAAVVSTTLPAHTSIMTGLYPPQHGVRVDGYQRVPDDVRTLAERLHDAGYRTGAFLSASVLDRRQHLDQGFEVYDDRMAWSSRTSIPRRPGAKTVAAAEQWLASLPADDRFLLWVHLYDAHSPLARSGRADTRFDGRSYAAAVNLVDGLVGRILAAPRIKNEERLIVHVIADHGESLGEHGEGRHGLLAYDATLRIPWIVRAPDVKPGARIDGWVSQVDLVPTTLELLGLPAEPQLGGRSLASLFAAGAAHAPERLLYAEEFTPFYGFGWSRLRSLRTGRWKYIESATEKELYDLAADPREEHDLAAREPETVAQLGSALRDYIARLGGDRERGETVRPDAQMVARLASLGYVEAAVSNPGDDTGRPNPRRVVQLRDELLRAQGMVDQRKTAEAVALLERMLGEEPINTAALGLLVNTLALRGQIPEAIGYAERVRALEPRNPARLVRLAELEEQRGDRARASALVAEAIALDTHFTPAAIQKASLLRAEGRNAEADDVLRQALRSDAGDVQLNLTMARDVELPVDPAAAEERLSRLVERAPYSGEAWRLLGLARESVGRSAEAVVAYQKGVEADPEDASLWAALGLRLARDGEAERAESAVREAMRLSPGETPALWTTLGAALADQRRFDEADEAYTHAIELDAEDAMARNGRALVWLARGQVNQARRELVEMTEEFPSFPDAENNLAAIAIGYRDWPEAETRARRALSRGESAAAWNNLGVALDEQGRDREAEVAYGRALAADATYWQARLNLAIVRSASGQRRDAVAGLEQVLRQVPGQPEASLQLAYLYRQGGDTERAREQLEAFLQVASGPAAEEAKRRFENLEPVGTP